jgi:hypothetical protein
VRYFRMFFFVLATIGLIGLVPAAWAGTAPRLMGDEVFELLARGSKDMTQSKFNAAQSEFAKVIKDDFDNPYANNNLAVLMEKQGKLVDAMTYLNIGEKSADQYLYKVSTFYLLGGVCAAVNPEKTTNEKSEIAEVIAGNKKKLAERMVSNPLETPKNSGH